MPLITPPPLIRLLPDAFAHINPSADADGNNDFVGYEGSVGLLAAQQSAVNNLNNAVQRVFNNQFVQTADSAALAEREAVYTGLTPAGQSLATRAQNILNYKFQTPPFTLQTFVQWAVSHLLNGVTPTAAISTATTWNYKLGSWLLGQAPFMTLPFQFFLNYPAQASSADPNIAQGIYDQIYTQAMVMKPCHMQYIPAPFINNTVASDVSATVKSALLNGTTRIPLTTSNIVDGSGSFTVTYPFTNTTSATVNITSLALQNVSNVTITGLSNTIFVAVYPGVTVQFTHNVTT